MVRWLRWHCPPDTGFEIRALAVRGRARYLSVTEAPHNTDFHTWMGKKYFCFFQTAETGKRTPNSGVRGSSANHYPKAPAPQDMVPPECNSQPVGIPKWHITPTPTVLKPWIGQGNRPNIYAFHTQRLPKSKLLNQSNSIYLTTSMSEKLEILALRWALVLKTNCCVAAGV